MNRQELFASIQQKNSFLCVGLDTDLTKIPRHLLSEKDPVFAFNKAIIDATEKYCIAYKPNLAFYEALGSKGWESLEKTIEYIPDNQFVIADAKRGDIGNTSTLYAKAFFESLNADAITVAPYMGKDSVVPFLEFPGKWVVLLAHTSNAGSSDFQTIETKAGTTLYAEVIRRSQAWGTPDNLMYVVGATRADQIDAIRQLAPDHFFLVPGIGAQGGDLGEVARRGLNRECGLIVNSSRAIIYADSSRDFAAVASREARAVQQDMADLLSRYC